MAGSAVIVDETSFAISRFFNTPAYLTPALFYYLFVHRFHSKVRQVFVISILFITVVTPLHRSYILSMFLLTSLFILMKQGGNKRILYLSIIMVIASGVTQLDFVNDRINKAFVDLNETFSGSASLKSMDYSNNTFTFRVAHLLERFDYVMSTPSRVFFGVGLLNESSAETARLNFKVGLFDELHNRTYQIDTGDLVWSMLLLQAGLIGTILYVVLMWKLLRFFQRSMKTVPYAIVGFLWIIEVFLISMLGVDMILIPFRVMILFLAVLVAKQIPQPVVFRSKRHSIPQPTLVESITVA